ncbi:MAG TPA: LysR family transcriptional regulator [Dehalococcoidia bacterium]|nr:LysR family transcriptional regulator [Dehalococcoidia bacterium]
MNKDVHVTQLRALDAISRLGSYTRAAEELAYTEPAVHQQIRNLERTFGFGLVERRGQKMELTAEGEQILPAVLEVLDRFGSLEHAVRVIRDPDRVVVGAGRHTGVFKIMPLLSDLRRAGIDIDVDLRILGPDDMRAGAMSGQIDVIVGGTLPDYFDHEWLVQHRMVLVPWARETPALVGNTPDGHRQPNSSEPRIVFLPPYGTSRRSMVLSDLKRHLGHTARFVEMGSADAAKGAAINGLGLAWLPVSSIADELEDGRLFLLYVPEPRRRRVYLLHPRVRLLHKAARDLIKAFIRMERSRSPLKIGPEGQASQPVTVPPSPLFQ